MKYVINHIIKANGDEIHVSTRTMPIFFFVYACARSTLQPLLMHMSKIRNKRENEATIEKPSEGAFILKHPGRRKAYSETRETEIRT